MKSSIISEFRNKFPLVYMIIGEKRLRIIGEWFYRKGEADMIRKIEKRLK